MASTYDVAATVVAAGNLNISILTKKSMLLTPAWNRLLLEWPPTDVFCSAEVSVHHWRRTCCHAAAAAVLCLLLYHNDIIHKFIIKIICGALHEYIMTAAGTNAE